MESGLVPPCTKKGIYKPNMESGLVPPCTILLVLTVVAEFWLPFFSKIALLAFEDASLWKHYL